MSMCLELEDIMIFQVIVIKKLRMGQLDFHETMYKIYSSMKYNIYFQLEYMPLLETDSSLYKLTKHNIANSVMILIMIVVVVLGLRLELVLSAGTSVLHFSE